MQLNQQSLNNQNWEIKKQQLNIPKKQQQKETKIKIKKLTSVKFPIKFKSRDYFNAVDYAMGYMRNAANELDRGNIGNSVEYIETILEYLNEIK